MLPEQSASPQHLINTKLESVKLLVVPSEVLWVCVCVCEREKERVCVCPINMLEKKSFSKPLGSSIKLKLEIAAPYLM